MSLYEMQLALTRQIHSAGRHVVPSASDLTEHELRWLNRLGDDPGFRLTCTVAEWWRKMRLDSTIPLTMKALARLHRPELMQDYFCSEPCHTLFFVPEAKSFIGWLLPVAEEHTPLWIAARFELALLTANELGAKNVESLDNTIDDVLANPQPLRQHPASTLLTLPYRIDDFLHALVRNTDIPAQEQRDHHVLVAPGLAHWWRPATCVEADVYEKCAAAQTARTLVAQLPHAREALLELLNTSALIANPVH